MARQRTGGQRHHMGPPLTHAHTQIHAHTHPYTHTFVHTHTHTQLDVQADPPPGGWADERQIYIAYLNSAMVVPM